MIIKKYDISLERDILRLTPKGEYSKGKSLKNISENNKFIRNTEEKYLMKIVTPPCIKTKTLYEKFCEINNILAEELYNLNEIIWPLNSYKDLDLSIETSVSIDKEWLKEVYEFDIKDGKNFYSSIKNNLSELDLTKLLLGNIKFKAKEDKLEISEIPVSSKSRYGITLDQINFLVCLVFWSMNMIIENKAVSNITPKNIFKELEKINKKYNLKSENAIKKYKEVYLDIEDGEYKIEKYSTEKALKLAQKYIEQGHLERYSIQGYNKKLTAECKVLIKDAIKQGVDYEILNSAKSVVKFSNGKHKEIVVQGTKTTRDNYIFPIITDDKVIAKDIMSEAGIVVPRSIVLNKDMNEKDIDEVIEQLHNRKLVIKPRNTNRGTGITVFSQVVSKKKIKEAIEYAFKFDGDVLVEEYVKGMEFRFLVINGKCLSIVHRRAASVVGDGKSTIMELIDAKNEEQWHYLTDCPVKTDRPVEEFLKLQELSYDSVIPKGKRVFLRNNSNCSTGGESLSYTNIMPDKFKRIAEKASRAFNAKVCGVDLIIEDLEGDKYSAIEINDNPGYSINEWPYDGEGEKIGVSILKMLELI